MKVSICRYMWVYIDALYMGVCVYLYICICGFIHMNDFFFYHAKRRPIRCPVKGPAGLYILYYYSLF